MLRLDPENLVYKGDLAMTLQPADPLAQTDMGAERNEIADLLAKVNETGAKRGSGE